MDVLLFNTNVTRCARSGYGLRPPPAGLISLAGVLRRLGHTVSIHQLTAHVLPQDEEGLPLLVEELRPIIAAHRPTLIGISARNIGAAIVPSLVLVERDLTCRLVIGEPICVPTEGPRQEGLDAAFQTYGDFLSRHLGPRPWNVHLKNWQKLLARP